jgi:Trk-type K+ transport system membrane component
LKLLLSSFRLKISWKKIPLWLSIVTVLAILLDFGFDQDEGFQRGFDRLYTVTLFIGIISTVSRYFKKSERPPLKALVYDILSILLFGVLLAYRFKLLESTELFQLFDPAPLFYFALFLVFIREVSAQELSLSRAILNPAQIFISSFIGIILAGAFLLMLPNATYEGISFINALFTSTSAVCVTGLIVVDTGSYFTLLGQGIILVLIQLGGLGIMTIASYFSYFFRGGSTYENQLVLSDMTNSKKLGEVFLTLKRIILLTIAIEVAGAVFIFTSIDPLTIPSYFDRAFFALFHSISSFCNAGFSTLSDGLYDFNFRFNYSMHTIIMLLFIVGGIGFPIVFNLFNYLKYILKKRVIPVLLREEKANVSIPWVINLNTRITLITSIALLVFGSIIFFVFEYNNSLAEHGFLGKIVTAAFSASTPRTAGFNVVDTSSLRFSTLMLIFLLMWIGASPASTGGGIKTSTFAIATLNFWSLAQGKDRIEIFRREIADISVRRAFAIISLSLVVIGSGIFMIAYLDSEKTLLNIAFECFSAYSTVGLSTGITALLSNPSKLVIIVIMLIGRVSMLSILIALVKKEKYKKYRYSKEEILIN